MKKFNVFLLVSSLFLTSAELRSASVMPEQKQVIVSSRLDWQPYAYVSDTNELKGSDVEILRKTLKPLDLELNHINGIPAKRLSSSNASLGFNTVLAATYNEERANKHYFSIPYRKERIGVFVIDPKLTQYKSMEQLIRAGYIGALNKSGYYGEKFEKLKQSMTDRFFHIGFSERRIEMLRTGRVDFIVNDIEHSNYVTARSGADNLLLSFVFTEQDVSFMFVKSEFDANFIKRFNTSLKEVLNRSNNKVNE